MAMTCIYGGECTGCMRCRSCRRNTRDDCDDYEYGGDDVYIPYYTGADIMLARPESKKKWRGRRNHQEVKLREKQRQIKKTRKD